MTCCASSVTARFASSCTKAIAGKGAAVRTGLALATGDYVLIQDADLEYDPDDWPRLIAPVLRGTGARRVRLALHR